MSIVERETSFVEGTSEVDAAPLEDEFDNIFDAVNALFALGEVSGTESPLLTGSYADIVGATASITVGVPSKVLVWVSAQFSITLSEATGIVTLNVDGSNRSKVAELTGSGVGGTASQVYVVSLAAGAHTLKLQGKKEGAGLCALIGANSGFSYLRIPEP